MLDNWGKVCWPMTGSNLGRDEKVILAWVGLSRSKVTRGRIIWQKCVVIMNEFINDQNEAALETSILTKVK